MIRAMNYVDSLEVKEESYTNYLTFGSLYEDKGVPLQDITPIGDSIQPEEMRSGKRGRPKGSTSKKKMPDGNEIILADEEQSDLPMYQSNQSYQDSYGETNNLLRTSIGQIDQLQGELKGELDTVRSSKTLKRKYDYISMLSSTASTLISTKVSAIKEMNKVITDSHNLDLKRMKDLKVTESQVDDDKRIMDMYQAFISTPVGSGGNVLGPNMSDLTLMTGVNNMVRADIGPDTYQNYTQNVNSTQNMMRLEQNSDVKTVVVYDSSTGSRWFDVMNMRTGESVPNVNKPDAMFLEDTTLDVRNQVARNTNLDITYPLIVIGNSNMTEY